MVSFVGNDQISSDLLAGKDRAEKEFDQYYDELVKHNLTLANAESPLHIVENAQRPEQPEPNRRVLFSVFSAIAVGTLSMILIFLLAAS